MNTLSLPVAPPVKPVEAATPVRVLPYVVSADIKVLLSQWALAHGFILPPDRFFTDLRAEFHKLMRGIFPRFVWVSEEEIAEGLRQRTASARDPLLSLERAYYEIPLKLELCRCVDAQNADVGLYARGGTQSLPKQLASLCQAGIRTVAIVDDVIFSGGFLIRILDILKKTGIDVSSVYTGIAIGEGMDRVRSLGYRVECVRFFPEVVDEICERDFFPGVPLSGRTLRGKKNVGVPYIKPFGLMGKWASIADEHHETVSERCLELTALLFGEIGRVSRRHVYCSDLERGVPGITPAATPFVTALNRFVS